MLSSLCDCDLSPVVHKGSKTNSRVALLRTVIFAIKAEIKDPTAETFVFSRQPQTELNFKFYRQATNKIVGLSNETAEFLGKYF